MQIKKRKEQKLLYENHKVIRIDNTNNIKTNHVKYIEQEQTQCNNLERCMNEIITVFISAAKCKTVATLLTASKCFLQSNSTSIFSLLKICNFTGQNIYS